MHARSHGGVASATTRQTTQSSKALLPAEQRDHGVRD
jgi:hypothetical protein